MAGSTLLIKKSDRDKVISHLFPTAIKKGGEKKEKKKDQKQ